MVSARNGFLVLLIVFVFQNQAYAAQPLSMTEAERATLIAHNYMQANSVNSQQKSNSPVAGKPQPMGSGLRLTGTQNEILLLAERRSQSKGQAAARLADVYYYDYSSNTLKHSVVNLNSGSVTFFEELSSVQLPLIEQEIQAAAEILMNDTAARGGLEDVFQSITGQHLTDINQLEFKAFVFHASTLKRELVMDSAMCGVHRCAQLILYTRDNISLDYSPIVDLSTGHVTQILGQHAVALNTSMGARQ